MLYMCTRYLMNNTIYILIYEDEGATEVYY